MLPCKPRLATAVPNTFPAWREIVNAMRTLADDRHEGFQWRQAEIASIRRELEKIVQEFCKLRREWPLLLRSELRKYGYNPEEPRIPEHHTGGGR
jgi:hypothetical protein